MNNTADNFRAKHLAEMDVDLVLNEEQPELIDEWQEVPAIWDAVRFKCDQDNKKGKYSRKERYVGSLRRSFYVGDDITEEDIKAKYENGILKLSVPKKDQKSRENKNCIAIEG